MGVIADGGSRRPGLPRGGPAVSPRLRRALGAAMLALALVATAATEPAPSPSISRLTPMDDPGLTPSRSAAVRHARIRLDPGGGRPAVTAELSFVMQWPELVATVTRESDGAAMALTQLGDGRSSPLRGYTFDPFASLDPSAPHDETFAITLTATGDRAFSAAGSAYRIGATAEYGGPPPPGASLTVEVTDASPLATSTPPPPASAPSPVP